MLGGPVPENHGKLAMFAYEKKKHTIQKNVDDSSTDFTMGILSAWDTSLPMPILIIGNGKSNLGSLSSNATVHANSHVYVLLLTKSTVKEMIANMSIHAKGDDARDLEVVAMDEDTHGNTVDGESHKHNDIDNENHDVDNDNEPSSSWSKRKCMQVSSSNNVPPAYYEPALTNEVS